MGQDLPDRQPDRRDRTTTCATSWCSANPGCWRLLPAGRAARASSRASARLAWPNGAVSQLFSAEEPDRLRGKQHMKLWLDELAAWRDPDAFDQALLGLRLGDKPQAVITTTPRPTKLIKQLVEDKNTIVTRGSTFDNAASSRGAFFERITARYAGPHDRPAGTVRGNRRGGAGRALDARADRAPAHRAGAAPAEFAEIVIGVDPPARRAPRSDECGIIVVGKTAPGGDLYVLADLTSQGDTPGQWGARVGAAFRRFNANRVVAEINNGGEMVVEVLRQSDPNLPVRAVTATRGKFLRAEPVAAAYERGIVHHVGDFAKLEDQLCTLTPDFDAPRLRLFPRSRRRAGLGDGGPARGGARERGGDDGVLCGGGAGSAPFLLPCGRRWRAKRDG